jgi:hypothetical protein
MGWISRLLGREARVEYPQSFITRCGERRLADAAFDAWTSGDLSQMLAALNTPTHPIDRHFLLQSIVDLAYKERNRSVEMRKLCETTSRLHLAEFPTLAPALLKDAKGYGSDLLPRVTTFQYFATLLAEDLRFDEAIEVCETALSYDLHDRTQGGFEARIERIRNKQLKASRKT